MSSSRACGCLRLRTGVGKAPAWLLHSSWPYFKASDVVVLLRLLPLLFSPPWPPCRFLRPPLAPVPPRLLVPRNHSHQPPWTRLYLRNPTPTSLRRRDSLSMCLSVAEPRARVARPSRVATSRAAATLRLASPPRRSTTPPIATSESSPAGNRASPASSVLQIMIRDFVFKFENCEGLFCEPQTHVNSAFWTCLL